MFKLSGKLPPNPWTLSILLSRHGPHEIGSPQGLVGVASCAAGSFRMSHREADIPKSPRTYRRMAGCFAPSSSENGQSPVKQSQAIVLKVRAALFSTMLLTGSATRSVQGGGISGVPSPQSSGTFGDKQAECRIYGVKFVARWRARMRRSRRAPPIWPTLRSLPGRSWREARHN